MHQLAHGAQLGQGFGQPATAHAMGQPHQFHLGVNRVKGAASSTISRHQGDLIAPQTPGIGQGGSDALGAACVQGADEKQNIHWASVGSSTG